VAGPEDGLTQLAARRTETHALADTQKQAGDLLVAEDEVLLPWAAKPILLGLGLLAARRGPILNHPPLLWPYQIDDGT
jgi:hypothetical protein